jgi:hypothetical protein
LSHFANKLKEITLIYTQKNERNTKHGTCKVQQQAGWNEKWIKGGRIYKNCVKKLSRKEAKTVGTFRKDLR